jgi:hypothetical protein
LDKVILLFLVALAFVFPAASAQDLPSQPKANAKVCVAIVSNLSTRGVLADRMTERLSKSLKDDKINTLRIDSSTTTDRKLHPTRENGEDAKSNECDYILLTQISDPKAHLYDEQPPQISVGGRVPSTDASDPLGGSSGPVYRTNLEISFALFRTDARKPIVDDLIMAQPSGAVSDNLLSAMDRESNRISHELKKK